MLDDETILSEPRTVILGSLIDNLSTIIHYCELYDCINAILSLKEAQGFLIEDLIAFKEMDRKEGYAV